MPPTPDSGNMDWSSHGWIQESFNASMCRFVRCSIDKGDKIKREWVKASRESAQFDLWVRRPSWDILGFPCPFLGVQERILTSVGLGGLFRGSKVEMLKTLKNNENSMFFADF